MAVVARPFIHRLDPLTDEEINKASEFILKVRIKTDYRIVRLLDAQSSSHVWACELVGFSLCRWLCRRKVGVMKSQ